MKSDIGRDATNKGQGVQQPCVSLYCGKKVEKTQENTLSHHVTARHVSRPYCNGFGVLHSLKSEP